IRIISYFLHIKLVSSSQKMWKSAAPLGKKNFAIVLIIVGTYITSSQPSVRCLLKLINEVKMAMKST
ncbi:unnamed protein product, partial [Ilex paraguariensis]